MDRVRRLAQEGLANVCLVGGSVTVLRAKVEANLPRKRGAAAAGYAKALDAFFERVLQATLRHVDWDTVKCLVIAGPGFAKDRYREYLDAEAVRRDIRSGLAGLIVHCRCVLTRITTCQSAAIACACAAGR